MSNDPRVPPRRPATYTRLTDEARDAWDRYCTAEQVTLTAAMEAVGRELAAGRNPLSKRVAKLARQIDIERRSRRP